MNIVGAFALWLFCAKGVSMRLIVRKDAPNLKLMRLVTAISQHPSVEECDVGIYYNPERVHLANAAGMLAQRLEPLPVLIITANMTPADNVFVHATHRSRRRKRHEGYSHKNEDEIGWCLLWILLVEDAAELRSAFRMTRQEVRNKWTKGSFNRNLVLVHKHAEVSLDNLYLENIKPFYNLNTIYITNWSDERTMRMAHILLSSNPITPVFRRSVTPGLPGSLKRKLNVYPQFDHNLQGLELTQGSLNWSLRMVMLPNNDNTYRYGYCNLKYIMDKLEEKLNFKSVMMAPEDRMWGYQRPNGSWTGVAGDLVKGRIDFCYLTYNPERSTIADFAMTQDVGSFTFTTARPKLAPQWISIIRPFNGSTIWLLIGLTLLASAFALFCMKWATFDRDKLSSSILLELAENFFALFQLFVAGAPDLWTPRKAINGFILLFCFFVLLVTSVYKSSLTSHLTKPVYTKPVESLEELLESDLSWGIVDNGDSSYALFANTDTPTFRAIFKKMKFCPNMIACLQSSAAGGFAYMSDTALMNDLIPDYFVDSTGQPMLITAKHDFMKPISKALAGHTNFPFIHLLGLEVQRQFDSGLAQKDYTTITEKLRQRGMRRRKAMDAHESTPQQDENKQKLTLYHLQAAFIIMIVGHVVALSIFLVERKVRRCHVHINS